MNTTQRNYAVKRLASFLITASNRIAAEDAKQESAREKAAKVPASKIIKAILDGSAKPFKKAAIKRSYSVTDLFDLSEFYPEKEDTPSGFRLYGVKDSPYFRLYTQANYDRIMAVNKEYQVAVDTLMLSDSEEAYLAIQSFEKFCGKQ